jgi:hypothetical protein
MQMQAYCFLCCLPLPPVHLLKYLDGKYFEELEVYDEAEYWETSDEKLCEEHFREMNKILDRFAVGLETLQKDAGESFESYFERLLKIIYREKEKMSNG